MKVFISHSDRDQAIYQTLCIALDSFGISRWDVSTMLPGESLSEQLRDAIRECRLCVFIATRRSIDSPWCLAELGAFWGAQKRVIFFMADPDLEESALPPQFRGNLRATSPVQLADTIKDEFKKKVANTLGLDGVCRLIPNRKQLYIECKTLIETSTSIRDTTWGRRARPLGREEQKAREAYRAAIATFMSEEKDYRELVTGKEREEFLKESYELKQKFPHYECRVLSVDISELSMLDMMIADNGRILLSHVSSRSPQHSVQYVYAESETLAKLFLQFYSDAWQDSVDIVKFYQRHLTTRKRVHEQSTKKTPSQS
jgi:hypothetical protein